MATTARAAESTGLTVGLITAADRLGIGRTKAYELARTGRFPVRTLRIGDRIRVPVAALEQFLAGDPATPDAAPTVGQWMTAWLAGRKKIRDSTHRSYEAHLRLHVLPYIADISLDRLTVADIGEMFDAIIERNEQIKAMRARGSPGARQLRLVAPATMQRIRATLRAGINAAIPRYLLFNPARHVEMLPAKRPKGLVWTPERIARWKLTGVVPSPVMVWTPHQVGYFLDSIVADSWYPMYHLIVYTGLRRGEACGLHWTEIDLDNGCLTVLWQLVQNGWATELSQPKTADSEDSLALDRNTVDVLGLHRRVQNRLRQAAPVWHDTGLAFTKVDGSAIHPADVTKHFHKLSAVCGLPPIRLHDLRHLHATIGSDIGIQRKVLQERLRHTDETFTDRVYTHVLPERHREAAEAIHAAIPRQRPGAQGVSA